MRIRWLKRLTLVLLAMALLLALAAWWALRASLAPTDGERPAAGLSAPASVERDERGYVSITAANRLDAARALGYVHAQERFFQMDLLRRNAAGELAELFGARAVDADKARRWHRFRARSMALIAQLPADEQAVLQAYAAGVNAGLATLGARPPEYLLLRQSPKPWQTEDSLLVNFSMYLDLQAAQGRDDLATGWAKAHLPPDWFAFLTQHSADWQAALDDSRVEPVPVPASPWPDTLRNTKTACADCLGPDARDIGSNNFAVAASRSTRGRAILANDMHLGLRVPGTWFKARLRWRAGGRDFDLVGLTLPGVPLVVAGSNGRVAWGYTNTTADWADVVRIKLNAAGTHYLSGGAARPFTAHTEKIALPGGGTVDFEVRETEWGPVMPARAPAGEAYVLRWVAHDREGVNLRLMRLESVGSVDEAVAAALGSGQPAQNLLLADATGRIAWTVIGAMPQRAPGTDADAPQDWSGGQPRWLGYRTEHPTVVDPPDGRLWTANARSIGGNALAQIGNGGYDLGARGQQIRDGLRAVDKTDESGLHAIQLDHRALFLQRWRRLLLDQVLTPEFLAQHGLADYRAQVERSADAARVDAVGYLLVREFRAELLKQLFAPLAAQLEAQGLRLRDVKMTTETPGWALLQAARPDTLPPGVKSWPDLLQRAVLNSRDALVKKHGSVAKATWGADNLSGIKHPLSQAVPGLGAWLDMPQDGLAGDSHMPRVANHGHGQSQRFVVSPGHEADGILTVPGGQSGHPLSPFYRADHGAWLRGEALPFLPGPARHQLLLRP
jgi:penicillin amidase